MSQPQYEESKAEAILRRFSRGILTLGESVNSMSQLIFDHSDNFTIFELPPLIQEILARFMPDYHVKTYYRHWERVLLHLEKEYEREGRLPEIMSSALEARIAEALEVVVGYDTFRTKVPLRVTVILIFDSPAHEKYEKTLPEGSILTVTVEVLVGEDKVICRPESYEELEKKFIPPEDLSDQYYSSYIIEIALDDVLNHCEKVDG